MHTQMIPNNLLPRWLQLGLVLFVLAVMVCYMRPVVVRAAAAYSASLLLAETNGTAYTYLPLSVTVDNDWLAENGFMLSTALDTRVQTLSGSSRPHMVAGDRTMFVVPSLPAMGNVSLEYATGQTALTSMDIVTGYGGYITVIDSAALELGSNFTLETSGYVSTAAADIGNNIVYKNAAFRTWISAVGTIRSDILNAASAWVHPTSSVDGGAAWGNDDNIWDNNTATSATTSGNIGATSWYTFPIEAHRAATYCSGIRYWAAVGGDPTPQANVDAFYGGAWHDVYQGVFTPLAWNTTYLATPQTITAVRIDLYNSTGGVLAGDVYEIEWGEAAYVEGAVASGAHVITTAANGADVTLTVDSVLLDTDTVAAVPDNGNNWVWGSNSTPYFDYIKHTVGGVLIVTYQPVTMIRGEAYAVGTVTVTNGDATVEGAGGMAWTENMEGSIFVSADGLQYVVSSVTDADTLELTAVYAGGTLAGQAYNMYVRIPDTVGAAQDGRITWGTNPAGTATTLGSLLSSAATSDGSVLDEAADDILIPVPSDDWFVDVDIPGTLLTNPLRPFVTMMSDSTNITELQAWRFLGLVVILFVTVAVAVAIKGHLLIAGIACMAAIIAMVSMTIWPLWALVLIIPAIIGGVIAERSPSL